MDKKYNGMTADEVDAGFAKLLANNELDKLKQQSVVEPTPKAPEPNSARAEFIDSLINREQIDKLKAIRDGVLVDVAKELYEQPLRIKYGLKIPDERFNNYSDFEKMIEDDSLSWTFNTGEVIIKPGMLSRVYDQTSTYGGVHELWKRILAQREAERGQPAEKTPDEATAEKEDDQPPAGTDTTQPPADAKDVLQEQKKETKEESDVDRIVREAEKIGNELTEINEMLKQEIEKLKKRQEGIERRTKEAQKGQEAVDKKIKEIAAEIEKLKAERQKENIEDAKLQIGSSTEASADHPGRNEDHLVVTADGKGVIICDGLGDQAARLAGEAINKALAQNTAEKTDAQIEEIIKQGLIAADQEMFEKNQADSTNMESTASVAYIWEGANKKREALIGNIGDSPVYLWHDGSLLLLTNDDRLYRNDLDEDAATVIQRKLSNAKSAAELTDDEQRWFANRDLRQAVGRGNAQPNLIHYGYLEKGDRIIIGSDGIFDNLTTDEITEIIASNQNADNKTISQALVNAAKTRSGETHFRASPDDITVAIIG